MKELILSKGQKNEMVALVSDEDFEYLSQWKWSASLESHGKTQKWYAIRWSRKEEHGEGKRYKIRMHRVVMGLGTGKEDKSIVVDHKNHNSLDNQRDNLEIITQIENMQRSPGWKGGRTWTENREMCDGL